MKKESDEDKKSGATENNAQELARWRMVLGKFASRQMPNCLSPQQQQMSDALEKLYGREYADRGVRQGKSLAPGSLDPSQLNIPKWLGKIQELFPKETYQRITQHAVDRYGLTELLNDPKTLQNLEPSTELLASIMMLKGQMNQEVLAEVRRLVERVVRDIEQRLRQSIQQKITGRRNRFLHTPYRSSANFDAHKTIRKNLKNIDPATGKMVVQRPFFYSRVQRKIPWDIILCVDQSGSMASSLIHSAILASAIAGLPGLKVKLVVFDTSVVDLTEHVSDPVEVLMSVQLGGGTNIGKAVGYCRSLVQDANRTVVVLITDFCEGASPAVLRQNVRSMVADGITMIGLASLDESGSMWFDEQMASRLVSDGMEISAVTPNRLAEWLAEIMNRNQ